MSDYQAGVLGPECLQRPEGIGIRTVRSPVGSSLGEPDLKRQHPAPSSIPSLSSHLSFRTPTQASYDSSLPDAMTTSSSRRSSSLFGASARSAEESNVSGTSGSQTSRMTRSSLSSGWSVGGATAAPHLPYAGPSGMVMTAQGSAIPDAGGSGGQVTQTFIPAPRVQVDQDDVEMAESRGARIRSARRSKTSRKRRTARAPSPDDPSGKSSPTDDDDARWNSKKEDNPEEPKSSIPMSEPLGRVGRIAPPPKEGDARDANGALKLTQDMMTRMELRQDQMSLNVERAFTALQSLAQRAIDHEERLARSMEAQRSPRPEFAVSSREGPRSAPPSVPSEVSSSPTVPSPQVLMRQAEEAARAELERRWEQQQAEVEEEKKAWETDIERTLNVQLAAFQQKIRDLEDARNRDQATIRILRK
ncbi:hypothetical protein F441_00771, partial [Phytophthora nicotianae CJ01A1]